jgi:hypothetical protein
MQNDEEFGTKKATIEVKKTRCCKRGKVSFSGGGVNIVF